MTKRCRFSPLETTFVLTSTVNVRTSTTTTTVRVVVVAMSVCEKVSIRTTRRCGYETPPFEEPRSPQAPDAGAWCLRISGDPFRAMWSGRCYRRKDEKSLKSNPTLTKVCGEVTTKSGSQGTNGSRTLLVTRLGIMSRGRLVSTSNIYPPLSGEGRWLEVSSDLTGSQASTLVGSSNSAPQNFSPPDPALAPLSHF